MKKLVLLLLLSSSLMAQENSAKQDESPKINWLTIEELEAAQAQEPRKVFIDLYTDWCTWCHKMDKATFQHPGIVKYVNANFYAVRFNAESKDTIHFLGNDYVYVPQGRRGYHQLAAVLANGQLSYPTIVYLNENLEVIQPVPGYMDPLSFEQVITYLAGNHYLEQAFEQYKKNYKPVYTAE